MFETLASLHEVDITGASFARHTLGNLCADLGKLDCHGVNFNHYDISSRKRT